MVKLGTVATCKFRKFKGCHRTQLHHSKEERSMRFSTSSIELQKVLGNIGGVIPTRSTLPILENFMFEVTDNKLQLTATDLDTSMSVNLPVKNGENGTIAVPATRLMETVRALPNTES